jgi:hypothetical protein
VLAGAAALARLSAPSAIANVRPAAPVMTCRRDSRVFRLLMCFIMA